MGVLKLLRCANCQYADFECYGECTGYLSGLVINEEMEACYEIKEDLWHHISTLGYDGVEEVREQIKNGLIIQKII